MNEGQPNMTPIATLEVLTVARFTYGDGLGNKYQDAMNFVRPFALSRKEAQKEVRKYVKGANVESVAEGCRPVQSSSK